MIQLQVTDKDVEFGYDAETGIDVLRELVFGVNAIVHDITEGDTETMITVYDVLISTFISLRDGEI